MAILAIAFAPAVASAQATMNFVPGSCATGNFTSHGPSYSQSGFTVTTNWFIGSWCADGSGYAGPAGGIGGVGDGANLTQDNSNPFTINSIDLANLQPGTYGPTAWTFTGNVFGGGQVFDTFILNAQSGMPVFQTFAFAPSFTNLVSVDFAIQSDLPYYQFTNIKLNQVTATPEPASMMLVATGLLGVFGVARRKHKA